MTKKELEAEIANLNERLRKRTIAFGIQKTKVEKAEKELKKVETENKQLAFALSAALQAYMLLTQNSCKKCKETLEETRKEMADILTKDPMPITKHLAGEETFAIMNLIDDPQWTPDKAPAKTLSSHIEAFALEEETKDDTQ